jgi:PAS domain S-box-containing protein
MMREFPEKISIWAFRVVIIISVIALAGWLTEILSLAGMGKNSIPMAPMTMICFMLTGFAALNLLQKRINPIFSKIIFYLISVISLIILIDSTTGYFIEFERIIENSHESINNLPIGRMSPATSILFLISAISLLTVTRKNNWHKPVLLLATAALLIAFLLDMGYWYGTPLLYGRNIIPPAWNTSLAFTFLFIGILSGFGIDEIPLSLFVGKSVRARLMRNFLPLTLLIIIIAGWLGTILQQFLNDHVLTSALVTLFSLLTVSFVILKLSKNIGNDIDHLFAFRKEAEETLTKNEERYRLISSVATDYTFSTKVMTDGSLNLDWVSGAFESISGYSVEEFKARGAWRASIHPEDLYIDDLDLYRLRNNQNTESQIRTIDRNGEIIWVQVFAHPIWDSERNCLAGIYGAVKNITDRKNAEEKLINSEQRFRELLEKVNLIGIILDTESKVTFCNEHLLRLTGYKQEEIIGQNWFDLMIPDNIPEVKEAFTNGFVNGNIIPRLENPILTKSGKKLDIVWSNVIQRKSDGSITGIASIGEDNTERKLAEEKIRILNEELELRVVERTKELEMKNAELVRMNKLFVGREQRMIELKNEIKILEHKLGDISK